MEASGQDLKCQVPVCWGARESWLEVTLFSVFAFLLFAFSASCLFSSGSKAPMGQASQVSSSPSHLTRSRGAQLRILRWLLRHTKSLSQRSSPPLQLRLLLLSPLGGVIPTFIPHCSPLPLLFGDGQSTGLSHQSEKVGQNTRRRPGKLGSRSWPCYVFFCPRRNY